MSSIPPTIVDPDVLETAVRRNSFTGVLTVDVGAHRVLERAEGFAHRALGVENSARTRFGTASGAKGFTALAIMRLVESGRLALHDAVRPILGDDLPMIDDAVTVEQLLTHTSGIGDYLDEEADWDADDYVLPVPVHTLMTAEDFVAIVDGYPQKSAPGERFSYCNGGYIVLAIIVERVAGGTFQDFVESEVCAPAGLDATRFLRSDELPGDAALGYLYEQGDRTNLLHLPIRGNGDGGLFTTADDLHRFWIELFAGRIVSADTVAEMTRPRYDVPDEGKRYGMGFWLHRTGPAVILEGYDAGVSFRSTHDPITTTTCSVLGNSSEGGWPVIFTMADALDGRRPGEERD